MDIKGARAISKALLDELIRHQPNLILSAQQHSQANGTQVAKFCSDFIDTYADYLVNRSASGD